MKSARQESISNLYSVHMNCDGELGALISQLLEEVSPWRAIWIGSGLPTVLHCRLPRDGSEHEPFAVTLSWTLDYPFRTSTRTPIPVPVPTQIPLAALTLVRGDDRLNRYGQLCGNLTGWRSVEGSRNQNRSMPDILRITSRGIVTVQVVAAISLITSLLLGRQHRSYTLEPSRQTEEWFRTLCMA